MMHGDGFIAERLMAQRVKEEHQKAKMRHLARLARGQRQGWVSILSHRLAGWLGRLLLHLAGRLQAHGQPPSLTHEGEASRSVSSRATP